MNQRHADALRSARRAADLNLQEAAGPYRLNEKNSRHTVSTVHIGADVYKGFGKIQFYR